MRSTNIINNFIDFEGNNHNFLCSRKTLKSMQSKKRRGSRFVILFVTIAILFLLTLILIGAGSNGIAFANSDDMISNEDLRNSITELIDRINTQEFDGFINTLDKDQQSSMLIDNINGLLRDLSSGEQKDFFSNFLTVLMNSASSYFIGFLPLFMTVIVICLLKSVLSNMTGNFLNSSTTEVVHIVCYTAVIVVIITGVITIVDIVSSTITNLTMFSNIIFPILLTLLSMLGGATSVALFQPFMAVIAGFVINIIRSLILPAFIATIVFSVVGNMSNTIKLNKLTKLIRSSSTWLLGIIFGLFATFLTVQGITGGVIDKFGFNLAKFALSSYVPILGGYISDGFDLLSTSLVLVKNSMGFTSVLVLLSIIIFPFLKMVLFTLCMRFTAAIVEPIGDERVATLMSSLASNMSLLITALAGIGFMFFILILLMIGSCNMGL